MKTVRLIVAVALTVSVLAAGGLLLDDLTHWLLPPSQLYPPLYWVLLDLRGLGIVVGLLYLICKEREM